MNIGEASDANIVLSWIVGQRPRSFEHLSIEAWNERARAAAGRLANRVNARLMTGVSAEEITAAWPTSRPGGGA